MKRPAVNGNGKLETLVDARTPLDVLLRNERVLALDAALGDLTPREREILVRRFLEGRTLRGVGQSIGITPGHVLRIQNRALRRLAHPARNLAQFLEAA